MLPSNPRPGQRPVARDAERGVAPRAFPVNSPVAGAERARYLSGSSASSASSSTAHLSPASASGGYARAAYARPPSVASVDSMYSTSSLGNSAYPKREHVHANSPTTAKYAYSPGLLSSWGQMADYKEEDDLLHRPDPKRDYQIDRGGTFLTRRGVANLGCLLVLVAGILGLFVLFPALTFFSRVPLSALGLGSPAAAAQAASQVRGTAFGRAKVDIATPLDVHSRASFHDPTQQLQLVWSDEFEVEGRSFYPGDDPFWEAVDLNYWQTGDLEWYDPAAITTANGSLEITLSIQQRENNHDLIYRSGMLSTWNKMCFSGGLVETKVSLPGFNDIVGLWPAVWTMGNLGRAGYGGSLEGMWPYSYDSCDVGTMPNQTFNGQPAAALEVGDPANGNVLSFLQGQKLSRCTCDGEKHPGPKHDDGTYVGRSAPEIDIIEATMGGAPLHGQVSQSLQAAPFNFNYTINGDNGAVTIANESISEINSYRGGAFQQAVSALSDTDQTAYELDGAGFSVYGYEYKGGFDDAYITWISNNQVSWTLLSEAIGADEEVGISARSIPQEPMYVIANLGLSPNFGTPDFTHLKFPAKMRIDYVRVYQHPDQINIGCSPKDFPTEDYINEFIGAYTNENLTTWRDDFGQPFPKNSFAGECSV